MTILQAKNGAVARLDSDIVFNDALKIKAEDNAFLYKMGRTDTVSYRRRGQGYNRQYASP